MQRFVRGVRGLFLFLTCAFAHGEMVWWQGGHAWDVYDLKVSGDGKKLFSAAADSSIKLWELPSGQLVRTFVAHTNIVRAMAINEEATLLATGADGGEVIVWETTTGKIKHRFGAHPYIGSLAFSPESGTLATGSGISSDPTIKLWAVESGALLNTLRGHTSWVHTVQFTPDGAQLISGSVDRTVKRWEVASGEPVGTMSPGRAFLRMALSADGLLVAIPATNILRYTTTDWSALAPLGTGLRNFFDLVYSRDASMLASAHADGVLRVWKGETEVLSFVATDSWFIDNDPARLHSVEFSPDGKILYSGGADYIVKKWDAETGSFLGRIGEYENGISSVDFSNDGSLIAVTAWTSTRICRASDGEVVHRLSHNKVQASDFSPDGRFVATASHDGTVRLWDVATGSLSNTYNAHFESCRDVAFAPGSRQFATAGPEGVRIWSIDSLQRVRALTVNTSVLQVAYSRDGGTILSGDRGGTLRWWRVSDGEMTNSVPAHSGWIIELRLSPDGQTVVTSDFNARGLLKFWRADGSFIREITAPHTIGAGNFSSDGGLYAAVIRGLEEPWTTGEIGVWRVSNGERVHTYRNETLRAWAIDWSKDNKIVYGRGDGIVAMIEGPSLESGAPVLKVLFSGGSFQVCVDAEASRLVRLERSTNLVDWVLWEQLVGTGECETRSEPVNVFASEFFRAVYPE